MSKLIDYYIIEKNNGNIAIMGLRQGADIQECIDKRDAACNNEDGTPEVEEHCKRYKKLPEGWTYDQYFRLCLDFETASICMDKAKNKHMENIRKARNDKLKQLDIETMKGIDVQPQKQKLRDLPNTFDLTKAATPEELKALWPQELTTTKE